MRKVKVFDLNLAELVVRFYLMIGVVAILGFLGQFTIAAILGFVLAISFILGVSFRKTTKKVVAKGEARLPKMEQKKAMQEAA